MKRRTRAGCLRLFFYAGRATSVLQGCPRCVRCHPKSSANSLLAAGPSPFTRGLRQSACRISNFYLAGSADRAAKLVRLAWVPQTCLIANHGAPEAFHRGVVRATSCAASMPLISSFGQSRPAPQRLRCAADLVFYYLNG